MNAIAGPAAAPGMAAYAQREAGVPPSRAPAWWRAWQARLRPGGPSALPADVALAVERARTQWAGQDRAAIECAAAGWRQRTDLRGAASGASAGSPSDDSTSARSGDSTGAPAGAGTGAALGLACAAMQATLGFVPYDTQVRAAWLMLDGCLVEMATGEGKTLAAALAAAAAALAGTPVHVLTANDYLVQRDRDAMAPMFDLLGLRSAAVTAPMTRDARAQAYRCEIVYATGRELVFDYLKDHVALHGERDPRVLRARSLAGKAAQPVVPGLHLAIVDEADAILLDEACIPFLLSAAGAAPDLAALQAARQLAARLGSADFVLVPQRRDARLTAPGHDCIAAAVDPASPLWPARQAQELVRAALVAEHLLQRDRDYAVTPAGVALIDDITGRIAHGRQWTGALHPLVELKEGRKPGPAATTAARITYQRFFPRYLRLGGMSGTLRESAHELRATYACPVVPMPLQRPSRLRWLGTTCHASSAARAAAVVERVRECVAAGRPVLVGTDSVGASRALSALLGACGIEHEVLNALQDADEALHVARAGEAGRVTVATNIAGRGTDIRLARGSHEAGGLHVILALANRARRIDRQLRGRGARHGDPGSAERILALDDAALAAWPRSLLRLAAAAARADGRLPAGWGVALLAGAQWAAEWRDRLLRRDLRLADDGLSQAFQIAGGTE